MGTHYTAFGVTEELNKSTLEDRFDELDGTIDDIPLSNIFINGGPSIWQRTTDDTGVTTTRKYVADRWAVKTGAGTLAHVQRSTTVRTGARSKYSMQFDGMTGVTTVDVDQRIEALMVGEYKRTITFSVYVYNGSGATFTPTLFVSTPSAENNWTTSTVRNGGGSGDDLQSCADGAWTQVTWTADVSGYTDIDNGLEFKLQIPSGSLVLGDTVRLSEFNLTEGQVVPFITRKNEFELCKRYFYRLNLTTGVPFAVGANASTSVCYAIVPTTIQMRSTPTISTTVGNIRMRSNGSLITVTSISGIVLLENGIRVIFNDSGAGLTTNFSTIIEGSTTVTFDLNAEL